MERLRQASQLQANRLLGSLSGRLSRTVRPLRLAAGCLAAPGGYRRRACGAAELRPPIIRATTVAVPVDHGLHGPVHGHLGLLVSRLTRVDLDRDTIDIVPARPPSRASSASFCWAICWPSRIESAMREVKSRTARSASSLPGMT
jgi:hypothetical protein